jgi:hypothetical protein
MSGLLGPSIIPASRRHFMFAPALSHFAREAQERRLLPLAPVALQGFVAGFRAFRAPLQPDGLAVWGQGRGENKPTARQPSSCAQTRAADMTRHDAEIEELREKVHCAVVLEQTPPCWKLDRKESTRLSLKYRRGRARSSSSTMPGAVGGIQRATLRAMFFASCKDSSQGLASDMSVSACERSLDCRHVFRWPIGQGAERSRTEPSLPAGPSERRFGRTLRPGATSDNSAGCRQRS